MIDIGSARLMVAAALERLPQSNPILEAELLLCQVLARPRSYLLAWPTVLLSAAQETALNTLLQRRLHSEPIAYILEQWEFWSLTLRITPAVLIPRPETELLVELALNLTSDEDVGTPHDAPTVASASGNLITKPFRVVDLGTGSGAIAAALSRERPLWSVHATDIASTALALALKNFQRLGLSVPTYLGDWYQAIVPAMKFDLIVSNPPYVSATDIHLLQGDLPWEPQQALVGGEDGLTALRHICAMAPSYLYPKGRLLVEHGYNQGKEVRDMLQQAGFFKIHTWSDLAGHERVTGGMLQGATG